LERGVERGIPHFFQKKRFWGVFSPNDGLRPDFSSFVNPLFLQVFGVGMALNSETPR
jgi:hypothetical protein